MITPWDLCLWLSGVLAGAGLTLVLRALVPQRIHHRFTFHHDLAVTVHHRSIEPDDDGENWKRL